MLNSEKRFYVALGNYIKKHRKEAGLSQKSVSEILNVSYQQFHKYETGQNKFSLYDLLLLEQELSFPVLEFMKENKSVPYPKKKKHPLSSKKAKIDRKP
jgi:transcriptional regulator with XRE-family HTH domain